MDFFPDGCLAGSALRPDGKMLAGIEADACLLRFRCGASARSPLLRWAAAVRGAGGSC